MRDSGEKSNCQSGSAIEAAVLAFEQAWQAASPPSISEILATHDPGFKRRLARELALIDMEFRWQASEQGHEFNDHLGGKPRWTDYVLQVGEIGELGQIPPEMIAEEYRIRQLWGDRPNRDQFISTFPQQFTELPKWLATIDDELQADGAIPPPGRKSSVTVSDALDSRAPLPWSDYLLQELHGSGGFGKVYRAQHKSSSRTVAVKALHKSHQQDPQAVQQFIQEAQLLDRLNHPGIVGVHGLGRYPGGGYFLVLDWIDGQDLQQQLGHGPASPEEAVRITMAVAEAIQHSHDRGVIHGDLKPSNVLVDEAGHVFVTDFGLAHLLRSTDDCEKTPSARGGTLAFMAPEVVRGDRSSVAVDVYGLGAILYALLTGQPPRQTQASEEMLAGLETGRMPVRPSAIRDDTPRELNTVAMKCLAARAEDRYSSAADVAAALTNWRSVKK